MRWVSFYAIEYFDTIVVDIFEKPGKGIVQHKIILEHTLDIDVRRYFFGCL